MFSFRTVKEELEAKLSASQGDATGKIEWKLYGDGERGLKLKLRNLGLADGSRLELRLAGQSVTELMVAKGRAEWSCDSREGETVPAVAAGEMAEINADGVPLLAGRFVVD